MNARIPLINMMGLDIYQLTTAITHADLGRLDQTVTMSFFFRKMPKNRSYVVATGLRSILDYCEGMRFSNDELVCMGTHPVLSDAFLQTEAGREVLAGLGKLDGFEGEITAMPEGTLAFAGPAFGTDSKPVMVNGAQITAYTPMIQVKTNLLNAKLIETPWLSRLNHMSMVASKAAKVVTAARYDGVQRPVLEFGQRRTHPLAAVDVSYAAYLAGCSGTSNLAATYQYGIPSTGTMDHFAVQASEMEDEPVTVTESAFFGAFTRTFPNASTLLVDTYDTMRGIRNAVLATDGTLKGVRIDSNVTPETIHTAKGILSAMGAEHVKVFVSDGLDEYRVRELAEAGADGFGVGENIACSPDAATGVGAVGKLTVNGYGKNTMKLSKGSGKATLPGTLQVYRFADHDLIALADEPAPEGGKPLLVPVWKGKEVLPLPSLEESRVYVQDQIAALPAEARHPDGMYKRHLVLSDALVALVRELADKAA